MSKRIRHITDTILPLHTDISQRQGSPKQLSLDIFPTMNKLLWGLKKKKLIIIAGRPSMGKSSVMMNMAWCFSRAKKKALFCNLETTIEEFSERLLSYAQEIDNFELLSGTCILKHDYSNKLSKHRAETKDSMLTVSEDYGKSFDDLIEVIQKTGDGYDVIFIDYLQKITISGRSERESLDKYLNQLCDLAIEKDVCIVLGSQINRATHEGKSTIAPMMHEIKGSGGIEEKAHQIWLLHWAWWYDKEKDKNDYEIRIAKNKDGRIGKHEMIYQPEYYKITEKINADQENEYTGDRTSDMYK